MKRIVLLIVCALMLAMCACYAEEAEVYKEGDFRCTLGNDRVGYLESEYEWFPMSTIGMTDEEQQELEENYGFVQYISLDLGLVKLTMLSYSASALGSDEQSQIKAWINSDYKTYSGDFASPQYSAALYQGIIPDTVTGYLRMYDANDEYQQQEPFVVFYFVEGDTIYHYMFEAVYDDDTEHVIVGILSSFTPSVISE